jgi:hypothetical protein
MASSYDDLEQPFGEEARWGKLASGLLLLAMIAFIAIFKRKSVGSPHIWVFVGAAAVVGWTFIATV